MKSKLHEQIAAEGEEILRAAFESRGWPDARLGAFRFGNWAMDYSQVLDPVVMERFLGPATETVQAVCQGVNQILQRPAFSLTAPIRHVIDETFVKVSKLWGIEDVPAPLDCWEVAQLGVCRLENVLLFVLQQLETAAPRELKALCRVLGYFKFVHVVTNMEAKNTASRRTMDFNVYMDTFDDIFKQYYPHLHLDRPASSTSPHSYPPGYISEIDSELRIHRYMRDDITVAAGKLAGFDRMVAHPAFRLGIRPDFDSIEFNKALAQLGAAMHLIEDFFAHSTFVEHAALAGGPEYLNWKAGGNGGDSTATPESPFTQEDQAKIVRRLMRHSDAHSGSEDPAWISPFLVTGTFDGRDTLVSLLHLLEDICGSADTEPAEWLLKAIGCNKLATVAKHVPAVARANDEDKLGAEIREVALYLAEPGRLLEKPEKILRDFLALCSDPLEAFEDSDNELASRLTSLRGKIDLTEGLPLDPEVSRSLLSDSHLPSLIKDHFLTVVEFFNRVYTCGKATVTFYKAARFLVAFLKSPAAVLRKILKELLFDALADEALEMISAFAKDFLENQLLGASRIGCHSLLAKDHGDEPMHLQSKACAEAVHLYVVETLVRKSRPREVLACRALPGGGPTPERTTIDTRDWVDWQELLFFFLRHPVRWEVEYSHASFGVAEAYVCDGGHSLYELTERFRKTTINPGRFTSAQLRAANPKILQAVDDRESLPRGIVLSIPDQARRLPKPALGQMKSFWWKPIFRAVDASMIKKSVRQGTLKECKLQTFHTLVPVSLTQVDALIRHGRELGTQLDAQYNRSGDR